mgnify:CR=1 FL=1
MGSNEQPTRPEPIRPRPVRATPARTDSGAWSARGANASGGWAPPPARPAADTPATPAARGQTFRPPRGVRTFEEYTGALLKSIAILRPIELSLLDASGCILADDVTAGHPLPSFDNSSMDGYAVRSVDIARASEQAPAVLDVLDDVPAGFLATETVRPGTAVRIMTGAAVPEGADCVVPVESTDAGVERVRVTAPVNAGAHIRRVGEDVITGDRVLKSGTLLGARHIGLLAALGRESVLVHPRPRVVVISTGSELVEPGTPLQRGLISDANSYLLVAAAQDAGAIAYRVPPVVDDESLLLETLEEQVHRADLIITSGGVSMGAYDTVKAVLARMGTVTFTKVAMNPGAPQGFGLLAPQFGPGVPIITLPGNPVSAFVSFEAFVRPAIRRMQGHRTLSRPIRQAIAGAPFVSPAGKKQFVRAKLRSEGAMLIATPVGGQGSHVLGGLAQSDCLIVIPPEQTQVTQGSALEIWDLRGDAALETVVTRA